MKKQAVARTVHIIASVIMSVSALLVFILYTSLFFEFIEARMAEGASASEELGIGLSAGFALIFMIIFGGADLVLSAVALVLSATLIRIREGRDRVYGIVTTAINGFFIAATAISLSLTLIIGGTGAI